MFMAPEVQYLGHKITKHGIEPTEEKVEVQSPHPTNVSELKAFTGLINYYGKFLPNLSTILNPIICTFAQRQEMELEVRTRRSIQES